MLTFINGVDDLYRAAGITSCQVRAFLVCNTAIAENSIIVVVDSKYDLDTLTIMLDYEQCDIADFIGDGFDYIIAEYPFRGSTLYIILPFAIAPDSVFNAAMEA